MLFERRLLKVRRSRDEALVDPDDDGFTTPTKPIGRHLPEAEAKVLMSHGETWEDRGEKGWRRVVASPEPLDILDAPAVLALIEAGFVVVANGGGGIPHVRRPDGSLAGVEAVIDNVFQDPSSRPSFLVGSTSHAGYRKGDGKLEMTWAAQGELMWAAIPSQPAAAALRAHGVPADSYAAAVAALRSGEIVGVFPEATISQSYELKEFKTGAVRMARDAGVPLLPCVIWGSQRVFTKGRPKDLTRGTPIRIVVGAPLGPITTSGS